IRDKLVTGVQTCALPICSLPMFHVHGLVLGLFGSQRRGGALHWVPRFTPYDLAAAVGEHGARAVLFAVPTMYHRLCEAAPADPRSEERRVGKEGRARGWM